MFFPVGALTSKPYAFSARSWELETVKVVDIFDSFGTSVLLGLRGSRVLRILPFINFKLNEDWITDRVRFSYDGFSNQRLTNPMIKHEGSLIPCSWFNALNCFVSKLQRKFSLQSFIGPTVEREVTFSVQKFLALLGFQHMSNFVDNRHSFTFFNGPENLDLYDYCLIVGANLRQEQPLLFLKLSNCVRKGTLKLGFFNSNPFDFSTSEFDFFGNEVSTFLNFLNGRGLISSKVGGFKKVLILLGESCFNYFSFPHFVKKYTIVPIFNFFGSLNSFDSGLGVRNAYSLLFNDFSVSTTILYMINSDNIKSKTSNFVVYQGSHGFFGSLQADLILPGCLFTEKNTSYRTLFGAIVRSPFVTTPPKDARTDWKILASLIELMGFSFNFNKSSDLEPKLIEYTPTSSLSFLPKKEVFGSQKWVFTSFFERQFFDSHRVDAITFSSRVLSLATHRFNKKYTNFF